MVAPIFVESHPDALVKVEAIEVTEVDVEVIVVPEVQITPTPLFTPVDVIQRGVPGPSGFEGFTFSWGGPLEVGPFQNKFWFELPTQFDTVRMSLNTPPTGSFARIDILKNGSSSIFASASDHPTVAAGQTEGLNGTFTSSGQIAMSGPEYITFSISDVGSGNPGADMTLIVRTHRIL